MHIHAWAWITFSSADLKDFTIHTTNHTVTSVQNYAVLTTITALPLGCSGLHLNPQSNKSSYALLLSALTSGQNLKIGIDSTIGVPWNSSICAINFVSLKP